MTNTDLMTRRSDDHPTVEDTVFSKTGPVPGPSTAVATSADPTTGVGVFAALTGGLATDLVEPDILLAEDRTLTESLPCRVQDADLWFADTPTELEQAKAFCADCPVRRTCLAGALSRREPWGVWGGEIFERGAVIARKRPRGRPRKNDVAA